MHLLIIIGINTLLFGSAYCADSETSLETRTDKTTELPRQDGLIERQKVENIQTTSQSPVQDKQKTQENSLETDTGVSRTEDTTDKHEKEMEEPNIYEADNIAETTDTQESEKKESNVIIVETPTWRRYGMALFFPI